MRSLWRFIDSFAQLVASEDNAKWFKYAAYAMTAFSVIFLLVLIGASHLSGLDGLLVSLTLVMHCVCVCMCAPSLQQSASPSLTQSESSTRCRAQTHAHVHISTPTTRH